MVAVEPVVELLLEIGITSPQAESLLRSLFVHSARERIIEKGGRAERSDVRVSLITGIHRNVVREILSRPLGVAPPREKRGHLLNRVLRAWQSDKRYLDDHGKPRDLNEEGQVPSFAALVAATLPTASARFVLQELMHAGAVESLSDHRVRLRSRTIRPRGLTQESLVRYGQEGRALLNTLSRRLRDSSDRIYSDSTRVITVNAERLALLREVLRRRGDSFLDALEAELGSESGWRPRKRARLAVSVIETEPPAGTRARRRRERR